MMPTLNKKKKVYELGEVFDVSNDILDITYVDRGDLDNYLQNQLNRDRHIALQGESKCGKTWLRKKNVPNALTVQCRFEKKMCRYFC